MTAYKGNDRRRRKIWRRLFRSCVRHPYIAITVFLSAGLVFWGGVNLGMDMTNVESFCISCHEMKDNVYQEYKNTIHYENRTGVRATCPDCHVPKEWMHMVVRKFMATNELFHKIMGTIDTPEKFRAKRLKMAEYIWHDMRKSDSRECRNCHALAYMVLEKQKKNSQRAHKRAVEKNYTCIDCHMGIAHKMAEDFDEDGKKHEAFKREKRPCADCHKGMAQAEDW